MPCFMQAVLCVYVLSCKRNFNESTDAKKKLYHKLLIGNFKNIVFLHNKQVVPEI